MPRCQSMAMNNSPVYTGQVENTELSETSEMSEMSEKILEMSEKI